MPAPFNEKSPEGQYEDEVGLLKAQDSGEYYRPPRLELKNRSSIRLWLLHGGVIALYTVFFFIAVWTIRDQGACRRADVITSSATSAIEYGTRVFDPIDDLDFYFGKPTPELDAKWDGLLKNQWLQLPASDVEKLGRVEEGIQLPDGGYFGQLSVYHDLHCLRRVHRAFHRDHYFPDMTDDERHLDKRHAAHCLDSLRQSIMCAGDVSLVTMKWSPYLREPIANWTAPHECVNWDNIDNWAEEHVYDVMAPGILVHPTLGPSYPDGKHGLGVGRIPPGA